MNNPKVSIIVPVYNVAEYLPQCLDSLINQTLNEIEIICIEDKSTDNSAEILKEYAQKDNRIKLIFNDKNSGTGFSRNKGLEIAQGEYIGFVDSDDFVSLDFYEILYTVAKEQNSQVAATSNKINYYDKNKQTKFITNLDNKKSLKTIKDKQLPLVTSMTCCNKIYKNNFLKKYDIKFSDNSYGEDLRFSTFSYIFSSQILISDKPVYFYRQKRLGSAVTGLKDIKFISQLLYNIKSCYDILNDSKLKLKNKNIWRNILDERFIKDLMFAYNRVKISQRFEFVNLIEKELKKQNFKKKIKNHLTNKKFIITKLMLIELLTFGKIKKVKHQRILEMEKAIELKKQLKIFER